jgi:cell division protein ZapD
MPDEFIATEPTLAPTRAAGAAPSLPHVAAPPGWMTFEFPCNERIRAFLRIESLMKRCREFIGGTSIAHHQAALWSLFEIYDLVSGRGDIKSELLQELDRQRQRLSHYAGKPGVADEILEDLMQRIQKIFAELSTVQTRIGPHLQEHEWLQLVRGRFSIPGGTCEFDVPSLHVWLHRPTDARQQMLNTWYQSIHPIFEGVDTVLRLLREGTRPDSYVASRGYFELAMDGRQSQIIRVAVPKQPEVVAEISANKYVVSVRFRQPECNMHLKGIEQDIPFQLTLCNL